MVLRRCSIVKEGKQSYSVVLYGMLAMASRHTFKEPVSLTWQSYSVVLYGGLVSTDAPALKVGKCTT